MENKVPTLFLDLTGKLVGFVPNLLAGLTLLLLGFLVAWFVKRLVIQVSIALRLERFLIKFRWGKAFSKADVRYGLYNVLGNLCFIIIFLAFLDLSFLAWDLVFLSDLLGEAISLFPRIATAAIILGFGWLLSRGVTDALAEVLLRERIRRATAVALYARIALLVLFSSMALAELDVAGPIVTIGFATVFITLGLIAVVWAVMNGKDLFEKQNGHENDQDENGRD